MRKYTFIEGANKYNPHTKIETRLTCTFNNIYSDDTSTSPCYHGCAPPPTHSLLAHTYIFCTNTYISTHPNTHTRVDKDLRIFHTALNFVLVSLFVQGVASLKQLVDINSFLWQMALLVINQINLLRIQYPATLLWTMSENRNTFYRKDLTSCYNGNN